jgi:hypothetical protein
MNAKCESFATEYDSRGGSVAVESPLVGPMRAKRFQ